MKLYTHSPSPNCIKVVAVANYLGFELEQVEIEPHSGFCRSSEFLSKNPNGLLPTLEDGARTLWESNAILYYLGHNSPLFPKDAWQQAECWRWMCWSMCHWAPAIKPMMYQRMVEPMIHHREPDLTALAQAEASFHPLAAILEHHLARQPGWVLGEDLSLADFALGAYLVYHEAASIPLESYPYVRAWYQQLHVLPAWQKALPQDFPQPLSAAK
ncbi:glutathione S-transferase family protein [bacterium]|nr:glutathione S-transferase family protein [bacterium]